MKQPPRIGDTVNIRGRKAKVIKIHRAGTIDVETLDGRKEYFRVTGLGFEDSSDRGLEPLRNPVGPRHLGGTGRPSRNVRFGRIQRKPYYRSGTSPAEIRNNPQHVQNLNSISKLERAGFEGPDRSLDVSLGEYGLAWKDLGNEWLFIHSHPNRQGWFDRATMEKDTDIFKEYNWVHWNDFLSYLGATKAEFAQQSLPQQIFDLLNYYSPEEIFGSSYWEGFQIKGIDSDNN